MKVNVWSIRSAEWQIKGVRPVGRLKRGDDIGNGMDKDNRRTEKVIALCRRATTYSETHRI